MGEVRLFPSHPSWPEGLGDLRDCPASLRVVGELPSLRRAVAVVGTRHASAEALRFAWTLGRDLTRAGCVVVSGGARGVDRAAHEGAMAAAGATVCVLPTGFRPAYPREHGDFFADLIQRGGVLLTEVDDGVAAQPYRFLKRNRLIAAIASAIVVVQAPRRSGALSTAEHGLRMGRPLFCVPQAPWDPRGVGCLHLLGRGAHICIRAEDVLPVMRGVADRVAQGEADGSQKEVNDYKQLDAVQQSIVTLVDGMAYHVDDICDSLSLEASVVQGVVSQLLVMGFLEERPGGRVGKPTGRLTEIK